MSTQTPVTGSQEILDRPLKFGNPSFNDRHSYYRGVTVSFSSKGHEVEGHVR